MTNEAVTYLLARGERPTRKKTQQISSDTYLPLVVMLVTEEGDYSNQHMFLCAPRLQRHLPVTVSFKGHSWRGMLLCSDPYHLGTGSLPQGPQTSL